MSDDPLARLLALRERPRRIVIGLLSGTSADGTDAALCEIAGFGENTGLVARAFVTTPFPRPLRERIYRVSQADASELTDLDVMLGEAFADVEHRVVREQFDEVVVVAEIDGPRVFDRQLFAGAFDQEHFDRCEIRHRVFRG